MHLNAINLPGYFACACIKPSKYFKNRIDDIQSRYNSVILLSLKKYATEADCSCEIILTEDEKKGLVTVSSNEDIFLLDNALPISRVFKVYFKSNNTKDKTITIIHLSSGFVPNSLVEVVLDDDYADYSTIIIPKDYKFSDLSEKIKRFDSLLGGFALMRLAGEQYMNYSDNYFSTLAYFNSVIEDDLRIANREINKIYWDAFSGSQSFKSIYFYINKELTPSDIELIAKQENQKIQKNYLSGMIDLNSLEGATYLIAVLYSYGMSEEGRKDKIDGLILSDFKEGIRPEKSEIIALCYGLNRGYTAFSNQYKTSSIKKVVKFELNSQVDYYTIESLYQYAFNQIKRSGEFSYLDYWCPKLSKPNRLRKNEFRIIDKVIIGRIIRPGDTYWLANLRKFLFSKDGEEYIMPLLNKLVEKIKSDFESYFQDEIFEKDELISDLQSKNKQLNNELLSKETTISDLKDENSKLEKKLVGKDELEVEVAKLQKELEELKYLYSKSTNVADTQKGYDTSEGLSTEIAQIKEKIRNYEKLIKEILEQKSNKDVRKIIKKFEKDKTNYLDFP